ncbi:MAG: PfkB family carbohydrate kinase, partial [Pseudomonadota bacterium]|nr:PfkB family carbohydrate kinase [Pseudomonadota bacterium]
HYRIAAAPANTIDSTGAGDAFNGALCASWARQPEGAFADHLRFAAHYAARATEHIGAALSMPLIKLD